MAELTLRGSCLCGGVAYEMSPPFIFFHHCHCSRCQKSSGSAFGANILVKAAQFQWTRGEELIGHWELPEAQFYCTGWASSSRSAPSTMTREVSRRRTSSGHRAPPGMPTPPTCRRSTRFGEGIAFAARRRFRQGDGP